MFECHRVIFYVNPPAGRMVELVIDYNFSASSPLRVGSVAGISGSRSTS